MSVASELLKAKRVGVRAFKAHISADFLNKTVVITDRGNPVSVNIPYEEIVELADVLDEFSDMETVWDVQEARKAIKAGNKGIAVSKLFKKIRAKQSK